MRKAKARPPRGCLICTNGLIRKKLKIGSSRQIFDWCPSCHPDRAGQMAAAIRRVEARRQAETVSTLPHPQTRAR
jgi:hypothetical protein